MLIIVHYCSGLVLGFFVGIHLFNHLLILHSPETHLRFMQQTRRLYRYPFAEVVLLTSVGVQVFSGIFLSIIKWEHVNSWFDWVQIFSGLYLSFFLANHVIAVMRGRHHLNMDTNLYYGAGVMNMWPQKLLYIPYYSLGLLAVFFHLATIHRIKMAKIVSLQKAEQQAIGIMILGTIITSFIVFRMARLKMPSYFTSNGTILKSE